MKILNLLSLTILLKVRIIGYPTITFNWNIHCLDTILKQSKYYKKRKKQIKHPAKIWKLNLKALLVLLHQCLAKRKNREAKKEVLVR